MYNYVLIRVSCASVFRFCFCAGTCLGGSVGVLLGILEQSAIGVFGGMFLGLLSGLISGIVGAVYAAVFNLIAPVAGGLAFHAEVSALPDAAVNPATLSHDTHITAPSTTRNEETNPS